jgi:hypothetical protein
VLSRVVSGLVMIMYSLDSESLGLISWLNINSLKRERERVVFIFRTKKGEDRGEKMSRENYDEQKSL